MSIQDEIYEKFFSTLKDLEDFPRTLVEDLKEMLLNEQTFNQQNLSQLLEKHSNGDKDQEN
jgi:hypothetical protein